MKTEIRNPVFNRLNLTLLLLALLAGPAVGAEYSYPVATFGGNSFFFNYQLENPPNNLSTFGQSLYLP